MDNLETQATLRTRMQSIMDNLETDNIVHKKANKNAINNGQSRDTGNIEHKKANKNAINNGKSTDTGNIKHKKANKNAINN